MSDAKAIHAMLLNCSDGMVLPRSFSKIYGCLRDFYVVVDTENDTLVGCCALAFTWENLAELRSLYVLPEYRGHGLARKLVSACAAEAEEFHIERVFVLTDQVGFFSHMNFEEIGKELLPHKVWADCIDCPQFPDCNEVAMALKK